MKLFRKSLLKLTFVLAFVLVLFANLSNQAKAASYDDATKTLRLDPLSEITVASSVHDVEEEAKNSCSNIEGISRFRPSYPGIITSSAGTYHTTPTSFEKDKNNYVYYVFKANDGVTLTSDLSVYYGDEKLEKAGGMFYHGYSFDVSSGMIWIMVKLDVNDAPLAFVDFKVNEPFPGSSVSTSLDTTSSPRQAISGVNQKVNWYVLDEASSLPQTDPNAWISFPSDGVFEDGKTYRVDIEVKAKEGFLINDATTFKINGELVTDALVSGSTIKVSRVFEKVELVEITKIDVLINEPATGTTPSNFIQLNTSPINSLNFYSSYVEWSKYDSVKNLGYDVKESWTEMMTGEEFVKGEKYMAFVVMPVEEGFKISETADIKINGKANYNAFYEQGSIVSGSTILTIIFEEVIDPVIVSSIDITIDEPIVGNMQTETLKFKSDVEDEIVALYELFWLEFNGQPTDAREDFENWTMLEELTTFVLNKEYGAVLYFELFSKFVLSDTVKITINGKTPFMVSEDLLVLQIWDHVHVEGEEATETTPQTCIYCDYEFMPILPHTHNFVEVVKDEFLKTPATCTKKAVYYKSCLCGEKTESVFEVGELLPHDFSGEFVKSKDGHYHECSCGQIDEVIPHTPGEAATVDNPQVCTVCGYQIQPALSHVHSYVEENATSPFLHTPATCTKKAIYYKSCICGEKGVETFEAGTTLPHDFSIDWHSDSKYHFHECSCGEKQDAKEHVFEKNESICDICGFSKMVMKEKGLSTGAIVAISVSSVLVLSLGGFSLFWFVIKKKSFQDLLNVFKKK